jgi:hypothetical protein
MSAFPYSILVPDLDTISAADVIASMGLNEGVLMDPPASWPLKGAITMGSRAHGSSVPASYHTAMTQSNTFAPGIAAINAYWDYFNTWVDIYPGENNTTTNARVAISECQLYLLRISTGAWERVGNGSEQPVSLSYHNKTSRAIIGTSSDKKWSPGNIRSFNNCYTAASRTASKTDNAEFYAMHNSLLSRTNLYQSGEEIDGADVAGVFVTCKSTLVPEVAGDAFNGTTEFLIKLGSDNWHDISVDFGDVGTYLQYVTYIPGVGGSRFELIPSDGSTRSHYFCTTVSGANTYVDNTSIYAQANGSSALYTPAATITANPPVLIANTPIP